MNHLTDEQLLDWLSGAATARVDEHLAACPACRVAADAVSERLSHYTLAIRQRSAAPKLRSFSSYRRRWPHRLSWAAGSALVVVLVAQTGWLSWTRPQKTSVAAPTPTINMSDDELLEAVHSDLSRDVPQALAPVGAITEERNRLTTASSHLRAKSQGEME